MYRVNFWSLWWNKMDFSLFLDFIPSAQVLTNYIINYKLRCIIQLVKDSLYTVVLIWFWNLCIQSILVAGIEYVLLLYTNDMSGLTSNYQNALPNIAYYDRFFWIYNRLEQISYITNQQKRFYGHMQKRQLFSKTLYIWEYFFQKKHLLVDEKTMSCIA